MRQESKKVPDYFMTTAEEFRRRVDPPMTSMEDQSRQPQGSSEEKKSAVQRLVFKLSKLFRF